MLILSSIKAWAFPRTLKPLSSLVWLASFPSSAIQFSLLYLLMTSEAPGIFWAAAFYWIFLNFCLNSLTSSSLSARSFCFSSSSALLTSTLLLNSFLSAFFVSYSFSISESYLNNSLLVEDKSAVLYSNFLTSSSILFFLSSSRWIKSFNFFRFSSFSDYSRSFC